MSDARAALGKAAAAVPLLNSGNLSGAERLLGEALAADPEQPRAHALMALLLYHRGRMAEAVRQADIAIGLGQADEAFRFKALALIKLKRWKHAIQAAEEAVRAAPTNGWNLLTLAIALENAKRHAEAETAFRRALELDPASAAFRGNLGRFLLRRRDVAGAERIAAELDPNDDADAALLLRGELALIRGRAAEARDFALWVLAHNATNEAALRLLTQVKASQSFALGLWWRSSFFIATRPRWVRVCIIIAILYLVVGLYASGVQGVWFLFIAYSLTCRFLFERMVKHELRTVEFRKGF
jgi:Flp pilus assembly protein TadD